MITETSLEQLLFGTPTILAEKLCRINISEEELLFRSRSFCTASVFPEELDFRRNLFFRKEIFLISYFFWRASSLELLLFQKTSPCIAATFSEKLLSQNIYFFRRVIISQLRFVSTATLTIYQLVIKWAQYQLRTLKLWEFFLVHLLLLKVVIVS